MNCLYWDCVCWYLTEMWASAEFGESQRGIIHGKSIKSLARACFQLFENVGSSFSAVLGNSFRQDIAAIFAKPLMQASDILLEHQQATLARAKEAAGVIIVAQDTTYFNYTSHKTKAGLTSIQQEVKGLLQHNVLAMDDQGLPLGVVWQHTWARSGENSSLFEKESDKWFRALEQVNSFASGLDQKVVLVQDRESDIFDFFAASRQENVDLIVRVCQDRKLKDTESEQFYKLSEATQNLAPWGVVQAWVMRQKKKVCLSLEVKASQVRVHPGKGRKDAEPVLMSLVSAQEIAAVDEKGNDCYNKEEAAHWLLFTTLELGAGFSAFDIVTFYSLRWRIERFHYVQKSGGLEVEKLLFDDVHTLINALAFYSIIAWRILYVTYLVRHKAETEATVAFEQTELKVLSLRAGYEVRTMKEAVKELGRLVGFQPSKNFPLPGAKKLGHAFSKLADMVNGFRLAENKPY